jgi:hypothetical protein
MGFAKGSTHPTGYARPTLSSGGTIVGDLAKLVGRFFARDFVYFIGGAFPLLAALFALSRPSLADLITWINSLPNVLLILIAGFSYICGYLVNLVLGATGLLNCASDRLLPWTTHSFQSKIARAEFFALNRYPLADLRAYIDRRPVIRLGNDVTPADVYALQALHPNQDYLSRAITLHHISSVIGSSFLVSAAILTGSGLCRADIAISMLGVGTFVFGIVLCFDSCYRAFQIAYARIMLEKWSPISLLSRHTE